jgi:hypothetical protein
MIDIKIGYNLDTYTNNFSLFCCRKQLMYKTIYIKIIFIYNNVFDDKK